MSALGDRIVDDGEFSDLIMCGLSRTATAVEWNGLRQELIDLRAYKAGQAAAAVSAMEQTAAAMGLRPCPVCRETWIGPDLVECSSCAGREDAAAKRREDQ